MKMVKKLVGLGIFLAILVGGFCFLLLIEGDFTDPIKVFYQWSGWGAFGALVLGMIMPKGKWWGLFALLLALLHLSVFVFFDFYFEWGLMIEEIAKKPYIYAGIGALGLMGVLGIFSLGKFYPFLKFGVWGAVVFSLIHIVMIQKVISWQIGSVIVMSLGILSFKILKAYLHKRADIIEV